MLVGLSLIQSGLPALTIFCQVQSLVDQLMVINDGLDTSSSREFTVRKCGMSGMNDCNVKHTHILGFTSCLCSQVGFTYFPLLLLLLSLHLLSPPTSCLSLQLPLYTPPSSLILFPSLRLAETQHVHGWIFNKWPFCFVFPKKKRFFLIWWK